MLSRIARPIDSLMEAMLGKLDLTGRTWARVGIIAFGIGAWMIFQFGLQTSVGHGLYLAVLSFAVAFGPGVVHKLYEEGRWILACIIGAIVVSLVPIEFASHHNYAAGLRGHNLTEARVQNTIWSGAQDAAKDDAANMALWRTQHAALVAEHKAMLEANPWAASAKPDGLKAELAVIRGKQDTEAKFGRGGRKAGCGPECERLKDQAVAVEKRIDAAARVSETADKIEKLARQIDATQRILDGKRKVAASTEHKSSAVDHANQALAKVVSFLSAGSLKPSEHVEVGADVGMNLALAFNGTALPAFCLLVAGLYRSRNHGVQPPDAEMVAATSSSSVAIKGVAERSPAADVRASTIDLPGGGKLALHVNGGSQISVAELLAIGNGSYAQPKAA